MIGKPSGQARSIHVPGLDKTAEQKEPMRDQYQVQLLEKLKEDLTWFGVSSRPGAYRAHPGGHLAPA